MTGLAKIRRNLIAKASQLEPVRSGTCGDNATWVVYKNKTMIISGTGTIRQDDDRAWRAQYGSDIHSVIVRNGITAIDDYTFMDMWYVEKIILPTGLTSIGYQAMYNCPRLTELTIPYGVTFIDFSAFGTCTALESISLPESLTEIGANALLKTAITELRIPASVQKIGNAIVYDNSSLATVYFYGTPNEISSNALVRTSHLTNVYVPWAERTVANAPWGATNATIHYNWTGGTA